MNAIRHSRPLSQTDKLCCLALAGLLAAVTIGYELADGAAVRAAAEDKPPAVELTWEAPLNQPRLLEAIALQMEPDPYREDVPLNRELQTVLREACAANGVPVPLALGLIEVESNFQEDADNGLSVGLMQLNRRYFPDSLTPAENIWAGVAYLGELLERYGDTAAALRAYNRGFDDGDRVYADAVLRAAAGWEDEYVSK